MVGRLLWGVEGVLHAYRLQTIVALVLADYSLMETFSSLLGSLETVLNANGVETVASLMTGAVNLGFVKTFGNPLGRLESVDHRYRVCN